MAKTIEVEVIVPEGLKEGDTFMLEVELPEKVKKPRGQLVGIAITDMTDEQLKREIINANSALYKAKQRNASEEVINANQARVDAARAEQAKRKAALEAASAAIAAASSDEAEVDEDAAAEM